MACECTDVEHFVKQISRHNRVGVVTLPAVFAAILLTIILIGEVPITVCIIIAVALVSTLLLAFLLVPVKVLFTGDELIVKSPLRVARYRVSMILTVDRVPKIMPLMCAGNRGFLGWWAWCDSSEGPITLIAQYKCRYVYKVITEDGKIIYVCTSEPLY